MKSPEKTVAFFTLGCKLNQFETYDLERQFVDGGYRVIPWTRRAGVYVINTCTVTAKSDYRCRQSIRKARRNNPEATVIAVGCYAQTQPGKLAGMPEVDFVFGNGEKGDILSHLTGNGASRRVQVGDPAEGPGAPFGQIERFGNHTRAFVKIQDGCDARCSYCIVPLARGPNRSRPEAEVREQLTRLAGQNYREIVLTGIHLGTWGRDLTPRRSLASLLRLLIDIPGLQRLRLSSIEPTEFSPELLEVLSSERICPHLHIPLQSGSPGILRAMGRPYGPEDYLRLVEDLNARIGDLGLGADVIAGFPGEGEREFGETLDLVNGLPLSYLHVFPFSKRPGTTAADMPEQVPSEERDRRAGALRELGAGKSAAFRKDRIGKSYATLIETRRDRESGLATGITGNYLKVLVDAPPERENELVTVRLTEFEEGELYGEIPS